MISGTSGIIFLWIIWFINVAMCCSLKDDDSIGCALVWAIGGGVYTIICHSYMSNPPPTHPNGTIAFVALLPYIIGTFCTLGCYGLDRIIRHLKTLVRFIGKIGP